MAKVTMMGMALRATSAMTATKTAVCRQWDEEGGGDCRQTPSLSRRPTLVGAGGPNEDDSADGIMIQRALPPSPVGKLKWGVRKLIAHAPITPVVIPFAHHGMERLLLRDEDTGRARFRDDFLASLLPRALCRGINNRLRMRVIFGEEIVFDDLINTTINSKTKSN